MAGPYRHPLFDIHYVRDVPVKPVKTRADAPVAVPLLVGPDVVLLFSTW